MYPLTPQGQHAIESIAQRYGFSTDAVLSMLQSVMNGNGTMAQFSHPEFGGSGQWMQGGMTMLGDMFNHALKGRVDGLCADLSALLASRPFFVPEVGSQTQVQSGGDSDVSLFVPAEDSGNGWPGGLGLPSSSGSQNDIRYAVFPSTRRLAIQIHGQVTVYDTLDHQIGGVSQQQGGDASLSFTSQHGLVRVTDLPVVAGAREPSRSEAPVPATPESATTPPSFEPGEDDVFTRIEKLAQLHDKGALSYEEFAAKKAELLKRV